MKNILLLAALSAVMIGLCACSGNKLPSLSGDEAREAFASATYVCVTGKKKNSFASSDVDIDWAVAGRVKEKGIINIRYVYSIDGKKQCYVASPWFDRPPFDNPDGGETVAYYDMDKNCIGYMQEVYRSEKRIGDYFFFDAESNPKKYYIPRTDWTFQGAVIYDIDGNEAGHIDVRRAGNNWFCIRLFLDDGAAEELSELDRLAMLYETKLLVNIASRSKFYEIKGIGAGD